MVLIMEAPRVKSDCASDRWIHVRSSLKSADEVPVFYGVTYFTLL